MKVAVTVLTFCVAALLALGMVMLYSASMESLDRRTQTAIGAHYLVMQSIWCALGLVSCIVAASLDYRRLKKFARPLFVLALLLLALVLEKHVGAVRGNARRWFSFHGISFQPSEFARLALIIVLAWYGEHFQRQMYTWKRGILFPGLFIGLTLGLIFVEPDVGNALLLASVSGVMLLIAGIRLKYFLPPVIAGLIAVSAFIYNNPMRSERVYSWLHLEETKRGKGMQAYQAQLALGSGGWTGLGLGNGRQKLGWVSEHHTDFILSIIGEELGLIATLLIVAAFAAIVICGIFIASHAPDSFGTLLATGITFLIGLQVAINIGVVTGVLPNKGLPLPFISYGGSNLLMMLTCVGLLLSVARRGHASENIFAEDLEVPEAQTA
jgi:cell division protein FtsW